MGTSQLDRTLPLRRYILSVTVVIDATSESQAVHALGEILEDAEEEHDGYRDLMVLYEEPVPA